MHPAYPVNHPISPHHTNPHRSWSDEHTSSNHYSNVPVRPGPRSSSFSPSPAPPPKRGPPPPVPPLPPSLLPGFNSPSLAHANCDFAFEGIPQRRPGPQPWSGTTSYGSSSSHDSTFSTPRSTTDPVPSWPSVDPNSSFGPPPAVLSRPSVSYLPNTPDLGDRRSSSYALAQNFRTPNYSFSPPPAVPPRPTTAHGEIRSERSPTLRSQTASSAPPIPPKVLMSPVTPTVPFPVPERSPSPPVREHSEPPQPTLPIPPRASTSPAISTPPMSSPERTPTPPAQDGGTSSPHILDTVSEAPEKESFVSETPASEPQTPETLQSSDLERALTLSLAESHRRRSVNKISSDEDDELARALAESLAFSAKFGEDESTSLNQPPWIESPGPRAQTLPRVTPLTMESGSSFHCAQTVSEASDSLSRRRPSVPDPGGREMLSPQELEDHQAHGRILQEIEDEEMTLKLQEEESERLANELREQERLNAERARKDAEEMERLQEEEARRLEAEIRERERRDVERARKDEELVRREEAEEKARKLIREAQERKDAEMARSMAEANDAARAPAPVSAPAPAYTHAHPQFPVPMPQTAPPLGAHGPGSVPGLPQYNDVVTSPSAAGPHSRPAARTSQSAPLPNGSSRPGRAVSALVSGPARPTEGTEFTRSSTVNGGPSGRRSNNGLGAEGRSQDTPSNNGGSAGLSRAAPVATPPNNVLDPGVLKGVSYGFRPPDIHSPPSQSRELSSCPPFPEVITLSRVPTPPFHIMALSWRHLMRLLAQLETRLEANLNVIARSKEENHLRVVIQFAKLPYTANTWRTILHLTLDEPVPRSTLDAWRFTNGDTTVLPYSYTLAPPSLAANPLSQLYVIPLSASSPFPILPISLPNLALYLQSAMQDSRARKVQSDTSNAMRRLARMVTACYPDEVVSTDKEEPKPSRGVRGVLRRVVGRGGDREESQSNEEFSVMITPFRRDQYA